MNILGLSCYYHDSAAALVRDGAILAAAQEERFSRIKHDHEFPRQAIGYCLQAADIRPADLDYIVFYEKPLVKFERILETTLSYAPLGLGSYLKAMPLWLKKKLWIPDLIRKELDYAGEILFTEHHEAHAAAAFFPSPFEESAILTMDGVGEWTTSSWGSGRGNHLVLNADIHFPHSLGLLYSAFTYYTGFKVNSGEYKVMGLAPYGEPRYVQTILDHLIDLREDGSFRLNMAYFNYGAGLTMTGRRFHKLFGGPPRKPESPLTQRDMDLARSIQEVTEMVMLRMARHVHRETKSKHLCLAGGVALNCVGNGRILREGPFARLWIQPASGDAGGALGAALFAWHQILDNGRPLRGSHDRQQGSLIGPEFADEAIQALLEEKKVPYHKLATEKLLERVAGLIADEQVIGWFQGRMEFGPRALGSRSIIGDARSPRMQSRMNLKIKFRESFRPFAPAVLEEECSRWFDLDQPSPYMLLTAPVRAEKRRTIPDGEEKLWGMDKLKVVRSEIPAVTHVDFSARVQTLSARDHGLLHRLVQHFFQQTGCPVIINTSFNVRGEPIVCTPEEAWRCFMRTEMDYLVMGHFLLDKKEQPPYTESDAWRKHHELD
ncbi:MAG TPA: carbamoyltransferase [bacterium]|nr:carbamoyltransferase [bacterium]HQG44534.1 carbamoyltransferase [bacterium]HQI47636.1 carbamoyltransferase [bacterium]HQJ63242.1 carbamoyltransferase [bacterium]